MEMKLYLQMLRKGWWIILLTVLVAVNATLIYSTVVTPRYEATASLLVSPREAMLGDDQQTISSLDTLDKESVVATYAEFLNSDKVYIEAINSLGLDKTQLIDYSRSTILLPDARVLEVTVKGTDPKIVASLANAISEKGVNYIKKFYQVYDINPIDLAALPTIPISPNPLRDSLLALVSGLILGAALAILSEQIRVPFDSLKISRQLDNDSQAYNRRHFDRLLELEMMRCRANSDVFSLGLVRLDGLADYIDNIPQVLLQKILQNVTNTLKKDLKGNDIVGRWNDTTFAILLPSTPFNAANTLIGRLRQKLVEPVGIGEGDETIRLEPYVGVARSKEKEVIEDFVFRVQKDLDENMYNVPTPPAPAGKPVEIKKSGSESSPQTPATSRLSALFASAPPASPVVPYNSAEGALSASDESEFPPEAPYLSANLNEQLPPATPFTSANPDSPFSAETKSDTPQKTGKAKRRLEKADTTDIVAPPPSELSQGIDDDLSDLRKNWKAN